jgi:hypothetical protein
MNKVSFNERVTVASLPVEEYREAYHARRGPWGAAPQSDELWDGDRRVFWERELTSEELKEILRFRRLARYASMLQGVGLFGVKVPMPKIPQVIEELVKEARTQQQRSSSSSPKLDASTLETDHYGVDPIALPLEEHDTSPRYHEKRKSANVSVTTLEEMYTKKSVPRDQFEFTNPNMLPQQQTAPPLSVVPAEHVDDSKKRLSASQKAAMQNAGKVLRLDSPRLGHAIHKTRSRKSRARKRVRSHAILQPWFVILYFLVPLTFLASLYFVPFWREVYLAWKDQKAIRTAIEVPYILERLLKVPEVPILQSTVFIGLFAVEVTSIVYILILVLTQLTIFLIVRPLILSLSSSFSERGAALD